MGEPKIAIELDYKQVDVSRPKYRMTQVIQQTGTQTFIVPPTAQQTSIFEIPAQPFNLARSFLQFTWTVAAPTLGAGHFNFTYNDFCPYFDNIQFYTRSGVVMADIQFCQMASKAMLKYNTSLKKYEQNDIVTEPLVRNNVLKDDDKAQRYDGTQASLNYKENAYVTFGNDNAEISVDYLLPLSIFKGTVFELDKDLHMGGQLTNIRFTWAANNTTGFVCDSSTIVASTITPFGIGSTISNLSLFLAQEVDESVVATLQAKILSGGIRYLTPFLYSTNENRTGTTQNVTLRYNRGHGQRLRKIYHTRVQADPLDLSGLYDTSNANDGAAAVGNSTDQLISYFYTQLDNKRLQEFNINCLTPGLDYMLMKPRLYDTPIFNQEIYQYNWIWEESWDEGVYDHKTQTTRSGIPLDIEKKWDIFVTFTDSFNINHFAFAVIEREIVVNAAGIAIV